MGGHFHSYVLQTWQTLGLCIPDAGTAFAVFFVGEYSDCALNAQMLISVQVKFMLILAVRVNKNIRSGAGIGTVATIYYDY